MQENAVYFVDIQDRVELERHKLRAIRDIFKHDEELQGVFLLLNDCIKNLAIKETPADVLPAGAGAASPSKRPKGASENTATGQRENSPDGAGRPDQAEDIHPPPSQAKGNHRGARSCRENDQVIYCETGTGSYPFRKRLD